MDGAKNAMYAQAGRSHSWSRVYPVNTGADDVMQAEVMQAEVMIPIPDPPVVELPVMERVTVEASVTEAMTAPIPDLIKPKEDCQEIGMAYVHMQKWQELYETEHGFSRGTIFAELDLPFMGKGACKDE